MVFFNFETGISEASSRCGVVFKECKIEDDVSFCSNCDLLGVAFVLSKICKFGIYDEATLRLHLAFEGRHGNLKEVGSKIKQSGYQKMTQNHPRFLLKHILSDN